ncbi:hypothetical protein JFT81_24360 [Pseudomonas sp. TH43]|uniref:hypothetical protein n=1 Tax=Pseudomonas sp. TH43 TaxID=2796407 RepID=UPI001911AFC8|nr:hypothetical protein [Pseudomonas sp. TH43]MBK5377762.1 hypothetical protein [Pseudomonas sp. TH43]
MSYSVAVEFRDTNADGQQEAIISRYNNGYAKNLNPDVVVTAYANPEGVYEQLDGVDDVEGNDGVDENDAFTYSVAAELASKLVGLSSVGGGRLYSFILISAERKAHEEKPAEVTVNFFNTSNTDLSQPDAIVTLKLNDTGSYKVLEPSQGNGKFELDADGDGDSDANDKWILARIVTSFVSMRNFAK